jgi:glutathione synthase/RimK-type ligase-like ATP-grasp enzyme
VIDCTLVTCDTVATLDPDDRLLANELTNRGRTVAAAVWSDPSVDWRRSKVCVLRSTWDYHGRFSEFAEWVDRASRVTTIWNPPELLYWNAEKRYLRDLEAAGVRIVPTVWARRGENVSLLECCERYDSPDVVIKPARGAATHDVLLVHRNDGSLAAGQAHLNRLLAAGDALVQPYFHSVMTYGERALVFIQHRYSHAVKKKPFDTVLAVRGSTIAVVEATPDEVYLARKAVAQVPGRAMYARVDLLRDRDGNPCVSEVELIEPALYLAAHPSARTMLADAVEREIKSITTHGSVPPNGDFR